MLRVDFPRFGHILRRLFGLYFGLILLVFFALTLHVLIFIKFRFVLVFVLLSV
jgi:hypothetical protein